jgi:putative ABC transport system ATP-binding protein
MIEIRNLTRIYHVGAADVRALDGVDLDIAAGEVVAVVGVSGSGKSTLLHLIGGLDTPTAGTIRVRGWDLHGLAPARQVLYRRQMVGFVFQAFHLVPSMTALENAALPLTFGGVFGQERRQRAIDALRSVGLENRLHHRPGQLSGGEQQRVAFARALVHKPALLLADEPTGNLDRRSAEEIMDILRTLQRQNKTTVILVTHDEALAGRTAGRLVRLRDGRVAEDGA